MKVTFEQIYFTGVQYLNQRLGGEIVLEEGETMADGWRKLKKQADDFHRENYPHLYQTHNPIIISEPPYGMTEQIPEVKIQRPSNATEGIIFDIDSVTDIKVLGSYKLMAKTNPAINQAYQNKLKELS